MRTSCVCFSFYLGLLPYLVAPRIPTCPSSGSPRIGIPLQLLSPPSALRIPTSTPTWTTSGPCTAARRSPWFRPPAGWAPQMVSLRPACSASTRHASPGTWHRVTDASWVPCAGRCAKWCDYVLSLQPYDTSMRVRYYVHFQVRIRAEGPSNLQPGSLASKWQRWHSEPECTDAQILALIHCSVLWLHVYLDWPCCHSHIVRV